MWIFEVDFEGQHCPLPKYQSDTSCRRTSCYLAGTGAGQVYTSIEHITCGHQAGLCYMNPWVNVSLLHLNPWTRPVYQQLAK